MIFSERENIKEKSEIVYENITDVCKDRLINCLNEFINRNYAESEKRDLYVFILDKVGVKIDYSILKLDSAQANNKLHEQFEILWDVSVWNEIFDILEMICMYNNTLSWMIDINSLLAYDIDKVLEEENNGYRMVDGIISPITDEIELESLDEATHTEFATVDKSMENALKLYSDKKSPNYEDSIKNSITAVESMCKIICNNHKVTLGQALNRLESAGVYIHPAMKDGFNKLYGYTSDEAGVRHGGIDESKVTADEAKYMLVTCGAFINYLKAKYSESKGVEENG